MSRTDILKGTPITESALLGREEICFYRRQYLVTDVLQYSFGRF